MTTELRVVCGVLIRQHTVLMSLRREWDEQGNCWEFPGGKVELKETDEEALKREWQEELAAEVSIQSLLGEYPFNPPELAKPCRILFYQITSTTTQFKPLASQLLRWIPLSEIADLTCTIASDRVLSKVKGLLAVPNNVIHMRACGRCGNASLARTLALNEAPVANFNACDKCLIEVASRLEKERVVFEGLLALGVARDTANVMMIAKYDHEERTEAHD